VRGHNQHLVGFEAQKPDTRPVNLRFGLVDPSGLRREQAVEAQVTMPNEINE